MSTRSKPRGPSLREERTAAKRKSQLEAYLFQRRYLFGCTVVIGLVAIIWVVAVVSDHWFIITGGKGIFITETRRYFLSSHSGLWKICRYTITPTALGSHITRNFTTLAYSNPLRVNELKKKIGGMDYITEFLDNDWPQSNITELDDSFRQQLFGSWVVNDVHRFQSLKAIHKNVVSLNPSIGTLTKAGHTGSERKMVNPSNTSLIEMYGGVLSPVKVNGTSLNVIIPDGLRYVLFEGWEEKPDIEKLLWQFSKDMNISAYVVTPNGTEVIFKPPRPSSSRTKSENGFEYKHNVLCKSHEMFLKEDLYPLDPTDHTELLGFTKTQATFACISLFVMTMGFFFSVYTFLNPRYMFKRLAGGIHFISAASAMVVIQVNKASVDYQRSKILFMFPKEATDTFGYGIYLAWMVFLVNLLTGLSFMWYSKKKKGSKAFSEELGMADEPTIIGR